MTAETPEITGSNQDYLPVIVQMLADIHAELHEGVRLAHKLDALLEEFRPLLSTYKTPLAAGWAARQAKKRAVPQDSNGQVQVP